MYDQYAASLENNGKQKHSQSPCVANAHNPHQHLQEDTDERQKIDGRHIEEY